MAIEKISFRMIVTKQSTMMQDEEEVKSYMRHQMVHHLTAELIKQWLKKETDDEGNTIYRLDVYAGSAGDIMKHIEENTGRGFTLI